MAPYPTWNASSSPLQQPQPTASQFSGLNQNQWGPDSIGTVFFGVVMFVIGITALWQGRPRRSGREEDEEQGRSAHVGGRPADLADEVATVDPAEGFGSERVAVAVNETIDEDQMIERGLVRIAIGLRTDTEGTLVGQDVDEGGLKELED